MSLGLEILQFLELPADSILKGVRLMIENIILTLWAL